MQSSLVKSSIYSTRELDRLRREKRFDPQVIRQLHTALLKRFEDDASVLDRFPAPRHIALHALQFDSRYDSQVDGATKLLLRTESGMLIESVVLRIATGRTTLCVSSQVGCAAACEFCATGKMGVAINLSAAEILDQVLRAGQLLAMEGRKIRNIVMMGMGEPFHNEENLYKTLEALIDPKLFHHSPGKILISSVGIPEAMVRCARRFPAVHQALSLHSTCQKTREALIPLAKKYPLPRLQEALKEMNRLQTAPVMIEYLMLQGMNDSEDDARQLCRWLSGLNVHVNLIPYNPIEGAPQLVGTQRAGRDAFAELVKKSGLTCTIRYSLGADIEAACGQLVRRENRGKKPVRP